jgi:hypothetical protein
MKTNHSLVADFANLAVPNPGHTGPSVPIAFDYAGTGSFDTALSRVTAQSISMSKPEMDSRI